MSPEPFTAEKTAETPRRTFLPPRWFIRAAWIGHRALYDITGGRLGLRQPSAQKWGLMRLRTVGRRSGQERIAILAYFTDGPNLVTMAMNGWGDPEPAWWLNLQAQPDVVVELPGWNPQGPRSGRHADRTPSALGSLGRVQRCEPGGLGRSPFA